MVVIKNILCPVDFFPASQRALDYATALAVNYEARLHILHVVSPLAPLAFEQPVDTRDLIRSATEDAEQRLKVLARAAGTGGIKVDVEVRASSDIDGEIKRAAESLRADLVAMGTHGRRGFQRWFMGSVTERLLRHVPVPMLTLAEVTKTKPSPPTIQRILVTTDFSSGTQDAISYALSIAQECQATLTLLHVIQEGETDAATRYRDPLMGRIPEQLESLVPGEARNWCNVVAKVEAGVPYQRILKLAETDDADLLVMNIHGKGMVDRALVGSTAERVIRAAPCPVLAIPPLGVR